MRANAMARVDDSIGTRAPILDSDCKIQSKTPIAPNRAYPFGPVLSMPETLVLGYHQRGGRTLTRCFSVSSMCRCVDFDAAAARRALSPRIVLRTTARLTFFGAMTTRKARELTFVARIWWASVSTEITSGVGPPTDSMIVSTDASIVDGTRAIRPIPSDTATFGRLHRTGVGHLHA